MTVAVELISLKSPKPISLNRACSSPPLALSASPSPRFQPLLSHRGCKISALPRSLVSPLGFSFAFHSRDRQLYSLNRYVVAFAASHEGSNKSEVEVENEKGEVGSEGDESQEAWKQALASFKEQALKMQSVSQEVYKVNSEKAMALLKETSQQLRIQAEKAKENMSVIVNEIGEDSRLCLSKAAEDSPEDVKEMMDSFPSAYDFSDVSKTRDYHVGLAYGLLLFVGGFLSFMLTGSIPAIRFGVILGGALLFLTMSSIKSQKKGEPYTLELKGQAAVSAIIFLREIRLLSQRSTILGLLTTIVSGGVLAFYVYKIGVDRKKGRGSNMEHGTES